MIGHAAFTKKFADETRLAREMGNRYEADYCGRFPWDTIVTLSHAALGRLAFYVHMHGGMLGSSFCLGGRPPSLSAARGYGVEVRVWLRPQDVALVEGDAKVKIRPAPMAHVCAT